MTTVYLTQVEVAARLRVSVDTLSRRMRETPDHIHKPWISAGRGRSIRWRADEVDRWFEELGSWLGSSAERTEKRVSGGSTLEAVSKVVPLRPKPSPSASPSKSKPPEPSAETGSLRALLRARPSR